MGKRNFFHLPSKFYYNTTIFFCHWKELQIYAVKLHYPTKITTDFTRLFPVFCRRFNARLSLRLSVSRAAKMKKIKNFSFVLSPFSPLNAYMVYPFPLFLQPRASERFFFPHPSVAESSTPFSPASLDFFRRVCYHIPTIDSGSFSVGFLGGKNHG